MGRRAHGLWNAPLSPPPTRICVFSAKIEPFPPGPILLIKYIRSSYYLSDTGRQGSLSLAHVHALCAVHHRASLVLVLVVCRQWQVVRQRPEQRRGRHSASALAQAKGRERIRAKEIVADEESAGDCRPRARQ